MSEYNGQAGNPVFEMIRPDVSTSYFDGVSFSGSCDGDGDVISNLVINAGTATGAGFFGGLANNGTIQNLGFENVAIYGDESLKGTLFAFAPGQELSEHTAARPAILHFLSGEADLVLGGERLEARPGTWVHMPAHLPHSIMARTQVAMLLLLLP